MSQQKSDINVLWLPGWYPSKMNFLPGDFTDRHAAAVGKFVNVIVIYVTKDPSLANNKTVIEVDHPKQRHVYRGYYGSPAGLGLVGKLWSIILYYRLMFKLYHLAKKEVVQFNLAHVHISLRQGLFAQWLKRKAGLPYVITEQNSWFMPVGNQYYPRSAIMQKIIKSNFRNANAVHVVSDSLGLQLKLKFPFIKTFVVIPNVVDTNVFYPLPTKTQESAFNFFTVTGDVYHKNTDGIIRAFAHFIKQGTEAVLHVAGPNADQLKALAIDLSVAHVIKFYGPIGYEAVAHQMQLADALIFFTRYETFGCVMAEALCCGTPVIASRIPVLEENLTAFENALFVTSGDELDLAEALGRFVSIHHGFDKEKIAIQARDKYNYEKIGGQFLLFYQYVLQNTHSSSDAIDL